MVTMEGPVFQFFNKGHGEGSENLTTSCGMCALNCSLIIWSGTQRETQEQLSVLGYTSLLLNDKEVTSSQSRYAPRGSMVLLYEHLLIQC